MGGGEIQMNEELDILLQRRRELIDYISKNNLQETKHYMKFLELQDVNLEIIKIENNYNFEEKNGR